MNRFEWVMMMAGLAGIGCSIVAMAVVFGIHLRLNRIEEWIGRLDLLCTLPPRQTREPKGKDAA